MTGKRNSTVIYLVRHGRTRANEEGRFAGRTDEPLLEQGKEQADKLGRLLAPRSISAIYTSPMVRTIETSRIMARHIGAPIVIEPGFAEIRIPQWDGRLKADLANDPSSGYVLWKKDPAGFSLPGAESLLDLKQRASACIRSIAIRHAGQEVVVVTHLAVIRCLILYFLNLDYGFYRQIEIKNASPLVIHAENDHFYMANAKNYISKKKVKAEVS